ncbi:MAG: GH36-type glycosyl hydrolase domain-containing protein [Thermoguttaceae bacterium]
MPRLRGGPLRGLPRIYDVALELVAHTDGRVDVDNLTHFVSAYQRVRPLKLGELWAIPIMLRLTLLENLRRVSYRIAWRRRHHDLALEWAGRFVSVVQENPRLFLTELAEFVRSDPLMSPPFIAELFASIEGLHSVFSVGINWIEQELSQQGQNIEMIRQAESQDEAANQASIGNTITSLRTLSAIDWPEFVESLSVTESMLRRDPAGVYPRMDFRSRDRYRHVVENLARKSGVREQSVARAAVKLAVARCEQGASEHRESHVGYFLMDRGLRELQRSVGYRPALWERARDLLCRWPLAAYLLTLAVFTGLIAGPLLLIALPLLSKHWFLFASTAVVVVLAVSRSAVAVVNWIATILIPPRNLPRLDFTKGIPEDHRTAVVIPTLLYSENNVRSLLEHLEVCHLANRGSELIFGILGDFPDASQEALPQDQSLLDAAVAGIRQLNAKYARTGLSRFFLLYRPRKWNETERVWMGPERKRGKLEEFNRLVRDGCGHSYTVLEGNLETIRSVKHVITLDADTQLPPESAAKLVGTIAHPLNRPKIDPASGCAVRGYGILQPRLGVSLISSQQSWFARLFAGEVGMDPYTREVSNVYHDLFGQGQYIGKGIYDVDAFHNALEDRFPPNRILSHDLIEGCHARCGFVNDVELIEDYPSSYLTDSYRRHRWTRGDWQIARWVLPSVLDKDGRRVANPLGAQSRLLIFDNLRRSLVPAALLATFVVGWLALPDAALRWTATLLAIYFLPDIPRTAYALLAKGKRIAWSAHVALSLANESRVWLVETLELVFLPFQACLQLDAIVRVLWRLFVSGRRLLQWQTAWVTGQTVSNGLGTTVRAMWVAPALAVATGVAMTVTGAAGWAIAGPILALWFVSPLVAWITGRPFGSRLSRLTTEQTLFLRKTARRTWAYFERFAGPEHHWLPADNFQEVPEPKVASRTSPTNIGMGLLSALAAYDFGYLSSGRLVHRTEQTFATLDKMERYRGHFYNWYDTQTIEPLSPRYVSSVDSGNLAASLTVLKEGLRELIGAPIIPPLWREGLEDCAHVLLDEVDRLMLGGAESAARLQAVREVVCEQARFIRQASSSLPEAHRALTDCVIALAESAPALTPDDDATFWLQAMLAGCDDLLGELGHFLPWLNKAIPGEGDPLGAAIREEMDKAAALGDLVTLHRRLAERVKEWAGTGHAEAQRAEILQDDLSAAAERATLRIEAIEELLGRCEELGEMDLDFLYEPSRGLLALGYSLETHQRDAGYYDLLASEARLCSFLAVARGLLPMEHWLRLGRQLALGEGPPVLVSWSGSLFEYLMPMLLMPTFRPTLLDQSCNGAVRRQIRYGRWRRVPWGISESGYNLMDAQRNYQYRAFGVPGLGLKRGLAADLVIAPYASALGLMVAPIHACRNLQSLSAQGMAGRFGLYEAMDFTPVRVQSQRRFAIVRSYMAHHSGMTLVALDYALNGQPMQRRFMADREFQSAALLLQERIPAAGIRLPAERDVAESPQRDSSAKTGEAIARILKGADTPIPEVHLLSNGRYHVMVTNAGGGYSRWQDLALTRWREDSTRDNWGTFFYVKDVKSGNTWSTTWQPWCEPLDRYEVTYSQGIAEFRSVKDQIEAYTRMAVSPEDDIEVRRITLTNFSRSSRSVEVTSYAEVVLLDPRSESHHPVYHGLFVGTELLRPKAAILCTRRPRSAEEHWPCLLHSVMVRGQVGDQALSFETDRARFIGRGRTPANPVALDKAGPLSDSAGHVLDPVVAIRRRIRLRPGETIVVDAITGVAQDREAAVALLDKYQDHRLAERVFDVAWTQSQVLLHGLRLSQAEAQLFGSLASSLLYADSRRRPSPSLIARNRKGQSGLWSYGVSGDLPIVLLRVSDLSALDLAQTLIQAHAYWRHKGLHVDLIIWAEAIAGYRQSLLDAIVGLVHGRSEGKLLDQHGGIFVRNIEQVPEEDRVLIQSVARVVLSDRFGRLTAQLDRRVRQEGRVEKFRPTLERQGPIPGEEELPPRELICFNGLGGFTQDGREYVVQLYPGKPTPAPWVNVLANPGFGTVVSESGGAYTWHENAHEFRLTPWYNDPVGDTTGEALYIRDEETGRFWSPTPGPAKGANPYLCRHGLGYSAFEHTEDHLFSETLVYVGVEAPVKFTVIRLRNISDRTRRFSVTGFCEWVLGASRDRSAMHVVTRVDPQSGAVFAWNAFNSDFAQHVAFYGCSATDRSLTGSRTEFIGRNGSPAAPAGMRSKRLSNRVGAGFDPCAAIQAYVEIPAGQQTEVIFVLGAAENETEARSLLRSYGGADGARQELEDVWQFWKHQLDGLSVETPDPAVNFLASHWLLYQVLTSRFWGRSGFYQSGGAYGFRDQLQDSLAFLVECPWLTRQHLLTAASRQFAEGDVQHWWHPPSGRGLRTRISDDYLWLPYVACRYVAVTGDVGILNEEVPFLDGKPLQPGEASVYDRPQVAERRASLYEHCVRAIRHGLQFGVHGLPLMGTGDWNDGMNRVGREGKGESVWLAFFLYDVLKRFAPLALQRGDEDSARRCTDQADRLRQAIEAEGWDGQWYKRAFFDDGTPLGSSQNTECRIDSLPQSWAVLSGAAAPDRAQLALQSVSDGLVDRDLRLIKLLHPPFDSAPLDPGYIRGYVPGVRENGGQYTHAAIWVAMAWTTLQRPEEAWDLFNLLNPIRHADTAERAAVYKVEPYVVAADVYAAQGHEGRGGWTWYTGSAGWMYQLLVENLLGLKLEVDRLALSPLFHPEWSDYRIHYRYRNAFYDIHVVRTEPGARNVARLFVDDIQQGDLRIHLVDDGQVHFVRAEVGH